MKSFKAALHLIDSKLVQHLQCWGEQRIRVLIAPGRHGEIFTKDMMIGFLDFVVAYHHARRVKVMVWYYLSNELNKAN